MHSGNKDKETAAIFFVFSFSFASTVLICIRASLNMACGRKRQKVRNSRVFNLSDYEVLEVLPSGPAMRVVRCALLRGSLKTDSCARIVVKHAANPEMNLRVQKEIDLLREISDCEQVVRIIEDGVVFEADRPLVAYMMPCYQFDLLEMMMTGKWDGAENKVRAAFRDIAHGVQWLHSKGIVHRDLKPENVLVDNERFYIADFEFALSAGPRELFYAYDTPGTQGYAAPEQLQPDLYDNQLCTILQLQQADIWSMGVIGFVICTLKFPFKQATTYDDHFVEFCRHCTSTSRRQWLEKAGGIKSMTYQSLLADMLVVQRSDRCTADAVCASDFLINN